MKVVKRLRNKACCLMVACLVLPPAVIQAGEVTDLYMADIPVKTQGDRERRTAIRKALAEVIVKVSGTRQTLEIPQAVEMLGSAMQYVQQFNYKPMPEPEAEPEDPGTGIPGFRPEPPKSPYSQLLEVIFDERSVNQAMRDGGLPMWGKARPSTLVWLAMEDWGERRLMGADSLVRQREDLKEAASRRGIPLMFPLMDLEDQMAISFTDVWGQFRDNILRASERYSPGGILVGRLYPLSADKWEARWSYYFRDEWVQWASEARDMEGAVAMGVEGVADRLAGHFAKKVSDEQGRLLVTVHDVESLARYARAMKYLAGLDPVKEVQVSRISDRQVVYVVSVRGNSEGFEQAIVFGDTLAPLDGSRNPLQQEEGAPGLEYRLLP